jgi:predicted hydrocarbon binding protein
MTIAVDLNATEVWWGDAVNISGIVERSGIPASNVKVTIEIEGNNICSDMPNTTDQGRYSCVFNAPYSVGRKIVRVQTIDEINNQIITNSTTLEVKVWWGEKEEEMERAKNIACYEVPKMIQNPDGTVKTVMVKICVWK